MVEHKNIRILKVKTQNSRMLQYYKIEHWKAGSKNIINFEDRT